MTPPLDIALCYESVLPARGGAETYIGDLARRLAKDGHTVHLYACRWDASVLPGTIKIHPLEVPQGPRFLRPWRFGWACEKALKQSPHDVTVGFDKTWGQDVLYPQGGLHAASRHHNELKFRNPVVRLAAKFLKRLDPAATSFSWLERKQYLGAKKPIVVVNSFMVRDHFQRFYGVGPQSVRVVRSAVDPERFAAADREERRSAERARWNVPEELPVGLFVAMNYRLKGLSSLIRGVARVPREVPFRIAIVGNPKFQQYEKYARKLGVADRLIFLGFRADPRDAYFAADYLVHPTFYDPCSLVALEALCCGLPVITTSYNGASELLTEGVDGFTIPDPHDSEALAKALTTISDRKFLAQAAPAARLAATGWTFERHYQELLAVFEEVRRSKKKVFPDA